MGEKNTPRSQVNYSFPKELDDYITELFNDNREVLKLVGITNKTQLMIAVFRNGEKTFMRILEDVKKRHEE